MMLELLLLLIVQPVLAVVELEDVQEGLHQLIVLIVLSDI
jgi:hypothetical protein